jgi:hypothetical protein
MVEASLRLIVIVLGTIGLVFCAGAWLLAGRASGSNHTADPRSAVLAGIGSGILTGAAVSLGVILLQQQITREGALEQWKLDVSTSWRIAGFDPHGKPYMSINYSGKELPDADFRGLALRNAQFRNAKLRGANFDGADLTGANFIGADLSTATFIGADLSGAKFQSANLGFAAVEKAESLARAVSNAETCWPTGFSRTEHWTRLVAAQMRIHGENVRSKGHTVPCPAPEPVYAYQTPTPQTRPPTPAPTPAVAPLGAGGP